MQIHVLMIEHQHGTNFSAHRTEQGAFAALNAYVAENWEHEMRGDTKPDDPDAAAEIYFEKMCDREGWLLDAVELEE
jgi:hypothetical protein